jgi:hypothetical protein
VSSTDTLAGWGDELLSADTGTLDENDFTVFNSQLSAGPLLSAAFDIFYYRAPEPFDFLGTYTTSVIHFGSGLPVGFYSIVTVTGLSALHINLDTTDLLIVQQVHSHLGPATRLGVVLMSPPAAVGANTSDMYIAASTIGPPGFYNVNGVPSADPGYRVAVLEPVPVNGKTWGSIKGKYR